MTCAYGAVYKELPTPAQLSAYSPWSIDRPEQIRAKMRNRKRAIVRSLRLGQADGDRKLAEKLAACRYRPGKRCYQPMCPSCVEGLRHSFIPEAATRIIPFIRKFNLPISWLCADLPGQRYQLGDLSMIELASLNRRVRRHYLHAGFPLVFSGIQLIIVEDRSTRARPFWQARVCSVIVGL